MSFSETGHAQNAAKFKVIIVKATALGGVYNPSKTAIKLLGLNTVSTNADASILAVDNALTPWQNAINAREIAFSGLSPRTTRIINALKATDATAETIKNAIFLEKKIHGTRITPKLLLLILQTLMRLSTFQHLKCSSIPVSKISENCLSS